MKRADKINEYYKNPNKCLCCGKVIEYNGDSPLHKALKRKFCSISCINRTNKKKENVIGIYCIENIVNGKKYVGQSTNIRVRWISHRSSLNCNIHSNKHLQRAWNKYGKQSFKFYVLKECKEDELDITEQYYIKLFDTYKNGYNNDLGGCGIGKFSLEQRKKVSNRMKKLSQSQEWRQKMIKAKEGKAIPIYQIDLNGNIIKLWTNGAREASRTLKINFSCIWRCINKDRKTYKGFIWIRKKEYEESFSLTNYINLSEAKNVYQYDLNGNFIKKWDSIYQASKSGFDSSSISKVCNDKMKFHKNFVWRNHQLSYNECQNIKTYFENLYKILSVNDKNEIFVYNDIDDVLSKNNNYNKKTIITALSAKMPAYGYIWVYYNNFNKNYDYGSLIKSASKIKEVYQYDKKLNYITSYIGLSSASKYTGIKPSLISACCNGYQKTAGGFIWKYEKIA